MKWIKIKKTDSKYQKLSIKLESKDALSEWGVGVRFMKGGLMSNARSYWFTIDLLFWEFRVHYYSCWRVKI